MSVGNCSASCRLSKPVSGHRVGVPAKIVAYQQVIPYCEIPLHTHVEVMGGQSWRTLESLPALDSKISRGAHTTWPTAAR